ncbi:MAG: transposase [Methylococcales bacterium]
MGKVDNCQVGVFAALGHEASASLIDARLYWPEDWASDPERCERAAIPKPARCYRSQSTLALRMLEEASRRGIRFGTVAIDGG